MLKPAQRESWEYKMQVRNTLKLDPTVLCLVDPFGGHQFWSLPRRQDRV